MSDTTTWLINKEFIRPILETQIVGLTRVAVGLPVDHLFDRFKTLIQASQNHNFRQLVLETYKRNGLFKGVFAGFSSQISIQIFKQYYRWPMMILIPKFYLGILPEEIMNRTPAIHKGLAGFTIALFESFVTCPLERIKCQLMTQNESKSVLKNMWSSEKAFKPFILDLFTGIDIMVIKQVVSWTNYLYWDHKIRYIFKDDIEYRLSLKEIVMCSILTAIPNIAFVQPFDTIKTQYQMINNQSIRNLSIWNAFKKVYHEKGIIGFYAGWQMRICQFMLQALLTTPVMDYLERLHGTPVKAL